MHALRTTFQWLAQRKPCSGFARPVADVPQNRRRVSRCQGPQRHVAQVDRPAKVAAMCYDAEGLGDSGHDWNKQHDQAAPNQDLNDAKWEAFIHPIILPSSPLAGYDELDFLANWTITVPYSTASEGDIGSSSQAASSSSLDSSSSSSSVSANVTSTSNCGPEDSCSNQHSTIEQSPIHQETLNECISKVRFSGENLRSAAAGSQTGTSSSDAMNNFVEGPVTEQLLPAEDFAGSEVEISQRQPRNSSVVYVLLSGIGEATQGIYSLRSMDDDELPQDTLICFESKDDAVRYATQAGAIMDLSPHVCSIQTSVLASFAQESGYVFRLELEGSPLRPSEHSVELTDWERAKRLRDNDYSELIDEPEVPGHQNTSEDSAATVYGLFLAQLEASYSSSSDDNNDHSHHAGEFTEVDLINWKAHFEALLLEADPASSQDSL